MVHALHGIDFMKTVPEDGVSLRIVTLVIPWHANVNVPPPPSQVYLPTLCLSVLTARVVLVYPTHLCSSLVPLSCRTTSTHGRRWGILYSKHRGTWEADSALHGTVLSFNGAARQCTHLPVRLDHAG